MRFPRRRPDYRKAFARAWRDASGAVPALDDAAHEAVRSDLETRTQAWAQNPEGLHDLRTELMDSVDRELVHRAFLTLDPATRNAVRERLPELPRSDTDAKRHLAAEELRILVLRNWAALYYGDRARGDWFDTYRRAAGMRKESAVRDLKRLAGEPPGLAENHRDAAVRGLNASLRIRLLRAPPGVKIGRRGLRARLRSLAAGSYHGVLNSNTREDGRKENGR